MAPLLVIAAFIIGAALGVYFGRKSASRRIDLGDPYDMPYDREEAS